MKLSMPLDRLRTHGNLQVDVSDMLKVFVYVTLIMSC